MAGNSNSGNRFNHSGPSNSNPERENIFIEEYLSSLNPYDAAIKAGYAESTARTVSYSWINNPLKKPRMYRRIQEGLRRMHQKESSRLQAQETGTAAVLAELCNIAYSDPRKLWGADGRLLHPTKWPEELARAVQSFKLRIEDDDMGVAVEYVSDIKLWPKLGALNTLCQIEGMLEGGIDGERLTDDKDLAERFKAAKEAALKAYQSNRLN